MEDAVPKELIEAARRVVEENRAKGRRVAVAESCTGGLVSAALTSIPGSSDVFEVGFITYSNDAKMSALGVDSNILETFGAVSIATAWIIQPLVLRFPSLASPGPTVGARRSLWAWWFLRGHGAGLILTMSSPIPNNLAIWAAARSAFRQRSSRLS